ncbi:MAG TPA: hypothetical protein VGF10_05705 [Gaiella sp.]|jgi:hypothetical protein
MTQTATQPITAERDVERVRHVGSLRTPASLEQLLQRFVSGFPRVVGAPMYGYDLIDPLTGRAAWRTPSSSARAPPSRASVSAWCGRCCADRESAGDIP